VRAIAFDHRQHGVRLAAAEMIWTPGVYFKRCISNGVITGSRQYVWKNDCYEAGPGVWQFLRR
jgi:hypothetical protein